MKQTVEYNIVMQQLKPYEKIFDIVRIVDPINKEVIKCKDCGAIPENVTCYSLWLNNEICENCITLKALNEKGTFIKIQHNADKMFLMFATPIEVNEEILVLELLKDITDNLVFETIDLGQGHEVRNITQDLNSLLVKDGLTDLYNRRYINQMLPMEITKSIDKKYPISIAMIDIDNFKNINDTYGHDVGDIVIKKFGRILTKYLRNDLDWVARYGGDEFLVYLYNTNEIKAYKVLEKMRRAIERVIIRVENKKIKITGSFGLCTIKDSELSASEFIKCADNKLYEAKNQGRNKVVS